MVEHRSSAPPTPPTPVSNTHQPRRPPDRPQARARHRPPRRHPAGESGGMRMAYASTRSSQHPHHPSSSSAPL
eukprot:6379712-Pyramimonas_sp.AAC.1